MIFIALNVSFLIIVITNNNHKEIAINPESRYIQSNFPLKIKTFSSFVF